MYINNPLPPEKIEKTVFTARVVLTIIFALLLFAFWNIQILKHDYFNRLAFGNISDSIEVKAPRGIILDRNGVVIAENRINFILLLNRNKINGVNKTLKKISEITGRSVEELKKKLKKFKGIPKIRSIPLLRDISFTNVIHIKSRPAEFKEFEIDIEPTRKYSYGKTASHLIGYLSEINEKDFKKIKGYSLGDKIGKSGVEKQYESFLRGKKGRLDVIKDNLGVIKETIEEIPAKIGHKVVLTIDIALQREIENILIKKKLRGAVGIIDLKTGGLLTLISKPGFDPYYFWDLYSDHKWLRIYSILPQILLIQNPMLKAIELAKFYYMALSIDNYLKKNYSLHNKFIQGVYSPGSIFKIVMALAGLEERVINKNTSVECYGVTTIYNRQWHCWRSWGHGLVNLSKAIENSCNIYFYNLGKRMNINTIAHYAGLLGLGNKTGIDIPNEINGLVPTDAFKFNNNRKWFPGDTISISIGGGMLEVTPAQALLMISTVALRGKKPQLHILDRIESKNGTIVKKFIPKFENIPIKKENFETVIDGLFKVVNEEGTARKAKLEKYSVCGKTGTQQIISKENPRYKELVKIDKFKPHAWFVSFAPKENPRYASVVFIEHGGGAGSIAAPIAYEIYKRLFAK